MPYCRANNQNQIHYWFRTSNRPHTLRVFLLASCWLSSRQQSDLKIHKSVSSKQHHVMPNNHSPSRDEHYYPSMHSNIPASLRQAFYLHRYTFRQFCHHVKSCPQSTAHQMDAAPTFVCSLHALRQMLRVKDRLRFHLFLNVIEIHRFFSVILHRTVVHTPSHTH